VVTNDLQPEQDRAQLQGVDVINLNELANRAPRRWRLPGEAMPVRVVKGGRPDRPGASATWDDGTMVVIEQGAGR